MYFIHCNPRIRNSCNFDGLIVFFSAEHWLVAGGGGGGSNPCILNSCNVDGLIVFFQPGWWLAGEGGKGHIEIQIHIIY